MYRLFLILALGLSVVACGRKPATPLPQATPAVCKGLWGEMLAAKTDDEALALYDRFGDALCDSTSLGVTCQDLRHQRDVEARTNMAQITIDVAAGDLHCSPWPLVDCAKAWRQVVSSSNPEDIIAYEALGCTPP